MRRRVLRLRRTGALPEHESSWWLVLFTPSHPTQCLQLLRAPSRCPLAALPSKVSPLVDAASVSKRLVRAPPGKQPAGGARAWEHPRPGSASAIMEARKPPDPPGTNPPLFLPPGPQGAGRGPPTRTGSKAGPPGNGLAAARPPARGRLAHELTARARAVVVRASCLSHEIPDADFI